MCGGARVHVSVAGALTPCRRERSSSRCCATTRTGETLGAIWDEIDLEAATWTIPPGRMKSGKEHVVVLSKAAVALLRGLQSDRTGFVFAKQGRRLGRSTLQHVLERLKLDVTVHGFRSAFADFVRERTRTEPEVRELCLAHAIGNATLALLFP